MSRVPSREETLFADALAQPAAERGAFLAKACGADVDLLAHLVALIAAHMGPETLLRGSAPPREVRKEEEAGDTIGRYKLLQKVGEGGCGIVWMAEQEEPVRRRVALKVIKLGMDTRAVVARFEAERQALAMMDHPCIAKVHDAGSTDTGRPFFVMELVRGIPITKYCDENHLTPKERLALFIKVCQAIQHAHQKGVIHRDIKPSNILVTVNDGQPTPKVIDFGIAKATQGKLTDATVFTAFEQFIGTPVYMSPEQAEMSSLDIDTRSDIYSLGVLLYELLTGRPPFDPKKFAQAGVEQIRHQIREVEPPRPSARLRTLDADERTTIARLRGTAESQLSLALRGDLDWIVMRCIEKDRTRRYDTANGLAMDIQRYLRNEPVIARPPSTAYLMQKLVRRHKVGFAATGAIAVTMVAGLTFSLLSLRREREEHNRAVMAEQLAADGRSRAEELLSFYFTEFAEELSDFGQTALLERMSARMVAYYEGLPEALHTRETRAAHALALAGAGAFGWTSREVVGGFPLGDPEARAQLTRALKMCEDLEQTGRMTPFMRLAFAGVVAVVADHYIRENVALSAIPLCERAEAHLSAVTLDQRWGEWAQRVRIKIQRWKALCLLRGNKPAEALAEFDRALSTVESALARRIIDANLAALRNAQIRFGMIGAYDMLGRRADREREVREVESMLRRIVGREPFLISARMWLALALRIKAVIAAKDWKLEEAHATWSEVIAISRELHGLDPKSALFRAHLAAAFGGQQNAIGTFTLHRWVGDFAAAEAAARNAIDVLTGDDLPIFGVLTRACPMRALLAGHYAATGRDREAADMLHEASIYHAKLGARRKWSDARLQLHRLEWHRHVRETEAERLNWSGVRDNADHVIAAAEKLPDEIRSSAPARNLLRIAQRDRARATFAMGDYAEARIALEAWSPPSTVALPDAAIQVRFERLSVLLLRIHVFARAGDVDIARRELTQIWSEVQAVHDAGPALLSNQVQTAHAFSIRAEIDGTPADKRAWLVRAVNYLEPAAEAGRLTRYEREVLLAGIGNQLSALNGAHPP